MDAPSISLTQDSVLKRIILLYGLHAILFNIFFVFGYYFLPEGLMRSSLQMASGEVVAKQQFFWPKLGMTLFFNLGVMPLIIVLCSFNQIKGFPVAYLVPISLAITGGLVVGTNSFLLDNLDRYSSVREAMALGQTIGGLETLGFILIVAGTVPFGVYQYRSWWRWSREYKPKKVMNLRDIRLAKSEVICLVIGILLLVIAAYRETVMEVSL